MNPLRSVRNHENRSGTRIPPLQGLSEARRDGMRRGMESPGHLGRVVWYVNVRHHSPGIPESRPPNPGPLRARFAHTGGSFPELLQKYAHFYTLFLNTLISHDSRQTGHFARCCKRYCTLMGGKTEGGWGGNTVWKKRTPVLRPVSDNVILEESWGISPRVDESVLDMYFTNHHFPTEIPCYKMPIPANTCIKQRIPAQIFRKSVISRFNAKIRFLRAPIKR